MKQQAPIPEKSVEPSLWATLGSLQFGISVLIAIVVVAIAGTLIPQHQTPDYYQEHLNGAVRFLVTVFKLDTTYRSPLFLGLLGLLGLNLMLCSVVRFPGLVRRTFLPETAISPEKIAVFGVHARFSGVTLDRVSEACAAEGTTLRSIDDTHRFGQKGLLGYLGSTIVHISLLVFIAGGVVSMVTGQRGYMLLEAGDVASEATLSDGVTVPLGFSVALDRFEVEFYHDHPGRPKLYRSLVTVTEPGREPYTQDIRVNHPLMIDGFTVFQSSYGPSQRVQAGSDSVIVLVRPKNAPAEMPPLMTATLASGDTLPVPGFGDSLVIRIAELHRDFSRGSGESGEVNPAALIDVLVRDEVRWSVYAFQNYPGMNMPMSPDLPLGFDMAGLVGGPADTSEPGAYYSVLGVVRDRGVNIIWIAGALMMLGLCCSLFVRPRRVWLTLADDTVHLGASTRGDDQSLREWLDRVRKRLGKT